MAANKSIDLHHSHAADEEAVSALAMDRCFQEDAGSTQQLLATMELMQHDVQQQQQHQTAISRGLFMAKRMAILATGWFLAFALFMPAGMMSDSGTSAAMTAMYIGLSACALFFLGGVVGCATGRWLALLPAVACLAALVLYIQILIFVGHGH